MCRNHVSAMIWGQNIACFLLMSFISSNIANAFSSFSTWKYENNFKVHWLLLYNHHNININWKLSGSFDGIWSITYNRFLLIVYLVS